MADHDDDGPALDDRRFAENMRKRREAVGVTQADLVRKLKDHGWDSVFQTTISRIEKGERPVRYGEARAIAAALGTDLENFLLSPDVDDVHESVVAYQRARDALRLTAMSLTYDRLRWRAAQDELRAALDAGGATERVKLLSGYNDTLATVLDNDALAAAITPTRQQPDGDD